jgi:hypothetical protein
MVMALADDRDGWVCGGTMTFWAILVPGPHVFCGDAAWHNSSGSKRKWG